ncbi:bleomycin hydrolase, partial [Anaerovibrio lipolyticus DSM 3074]
EEEDALLCSLDRIFDNAIVFNLKGKSYRGRKLKVVNVQVDNLNHEDK